MALVVVPPLKPTTDPSSANSAAAEAIRSLALSPEARLVAGGQVVGHGRRDHPAVGTGHQLLRRELAEVAADRGLRDTELLDDLRDRQPAVLGEQAQQRAPPRAPVHGPARSRHFTDPAVRPPTRCFSMTAKRITTGTMAMIAAANSWSQCCSYPVT